MDPAEPETPATVEDSAQAATPQPVVDLYRNRDIVSSDSDESYRGLRWVFIGSNGLRTGWSATIFIALIFFFMVLLGTITAAIGYHAQDGDSVILAPKSALIIEITYLLSLLGAGLLTALIEGRRIPDYNLAGPRRATHFASGVVAGLATLSVLVAAMAWGGWVHFGPVALTGSRIYFYAAFWAVVFLLTGLFEEGVFRCYLLAILTRGINFWWALAVVGVICLAGLLATSGLGVRGVYFAALAGLVPCLCLHIKKVPSASFWYASWVTSTFFGFIHTGNGGENWIGIFAAALIGFIFCVSVRLTGSAWWAIGCHAAWDWAETYFYGTADSGMVAQGHLLTSNPMGNTLWSGGLDGPEGSLLVIAVILLLLVALVAMYGRQKQALVSGI